MRVRWSTAAAEDLERIYDFIVETSPDSARRVAAIILEGIGTLPNFQIVADLVGSRTHEINLRSSPIRSCL